MPHRNPIIAHHHLEIADTERQRLQALASKLSANEPNLGAFRPFGSMVAPGLGDFPNFAIEDHSAISLSETVGDQRYAYRALLLAGDGDDVAIEGPRSTAFEAYCENILGLGHPTLLPVPDGAVRSLTERAANDPDIVTRMTDRAREAGGLNILPYMGMGQVWRLAAQIAAGATVPIRVAAPPPRLTRRVNDKIWFAQRVGEILGDTARPRSYAAFGPAALAGLVRKLSARNASVAVKVPDSASSAGNIVIDADEGRHGTIADLRDDLLRMLTLSGWRGRYPLMVSGWERPVLASPSAQIWIPEAKQGAPVVEGLFDQAILGRKRAFAGATPSTFSAAVQQRIVEEASRLGFVWQQLGYFGRCSFDAILLGTTESEAVLHWIECNGRWGGVSIPMTLANRLVGDWLRRPFVVIERRDLNGRPRPLGWWLDRLSGLLFDRNHSDPLGAVILSPGRLEDGSGFELMVIGRSVVDARRRAEAVLHRIVAAAKD